MVIIFAFGNCRIILTLVVLAYKSSIIAHAINFLVSLNDGRFLLNISDST